MKPVFLKIAIHLVLYLLLQVLSVDCWALSSANIPLDSPVYTYLEKLSGFGLIKGDIRGIRPFSKSEAARLLLEAEDSLASTNSGSPAFAQELVLRIKDIIPREISLHNSIQKPPIFDYNPISSIRFRYVNVDGIPRSYDRAVHDPGDDGVFGIGSGLRPRNPYPSPVQQHGSEGTPLIENNNGVIYRSGNNGEFRWAAEAYISDKVTCLLEPSILTTVEGTQIRLNRGYIKLGGGGLELEVGKDENWFGQGARGNIVLTNNAENFTVVKLSSPEPVTASWLSWLGDLKYSLIASRFDRTSTGGLDRQPWFYALKLISKPSDDFEIGFNLGRQQGGPGVNNGLGDSIRGLIGGTGADNSNGLAGFELRYRMPWLRNTEFFAEFSGEDTAAFWPIVESYIAGFYIPRLSPDGKNDFRFEFFNGNQILYTNGTFSEGYIYKNLPIGHSQGGATQDFFARYSHWFTARHNLALEYIFTQRGNIGRVKVDGMGNFASNGTMQAIERKNAARAYWRLPLHDHMDMKLMYGWERIKNWGLVSGVSRQDQIICAELSYRY